MRVFTSSPIIKAFDVFTLEASNGVCIILRGFLNKQRLVQSGFLLEISREFIFGFPLCWEAKCNHCFVGLPSGEVIDKASRTILSPCNNAKWNLEDSSALVENNTEEINDNGGGSTARDERPSRKKSLRLQAKSVELSKVKNKTTNHGSEGLSKAKSSGVEKDECEVINNEVVSLTLEQGKGEVEATKACPLSLQTDLEKSGKRGKQAVAKKSCKILRSDANVEVEHVNHSGTKFKRKLDVSEVQKNPTTNDVGHGSEGLNKAKSNGVERDEECMGNEEISRVDGCGKMHSGTNSKKITSKKNATKDSLTSKQRKGMLKVIKTSLSDSSKQRKNGKSKKSEKILKDDLEVVEEPMTRSGSKVKDNLSVGKTIRKIDFDEEVTPEKDAKKQKKTNAVMSADSLGQKRSRSGRVLVSPLEYWRNQIPVYDVDRNLIQVNEGHQTNSTPSKGKGSVSRKPRR
ncbi:hypothetical protein N665_0319s0050 [Sinapis alba]|nr:hypothetical protein N665_0319s0050 [Sinapis alba]